VINDKPVLTGIYARIDTLAMVPISFSGISLFLEILPLTNTFDGLRNTVQWILEYMTFVLTCASPPILQKNLADFFHIKCRITEDYIIRIYRLSVHHPGVEKIYFSMTQTMLRWDEKFS
jgi:hypothetical protein